MFMILAIFHVLVDFSSFVYQFVELSCKILLSLV